MIDVEIKNKIKQFYDENPVAIGNKASLSDIELIERELNLKLDENYIDFITTFGGGVLGAYEIHSISNSQILGDMNVIDLNNHFKKDEWIGIDDWFIFGSDGSGNPIGIDTNGKIMSNDHDFNGIYVISESFQEYLEEILNELSSE